jgi:predicted NAD/FAD-dependent oxidoreductase
MPDSPSDTDPRKGLSIAVIGNGIAGASAARHFASIMPDDLRQLSIHEIGRGPGGRAGTRQSRAIPELRINHGAPCADITTEAGKALLPSLGDAVRPYSGRPGVLDGRTGAFRPDAGHGDAALVTARSGQMADLAGALLQDASGERLHPIATHYSSMVRGLARGEDGGDEWILADKTGAELGRADWLIVAGSGVAHPRWSDTFGGTPPLVEAAAGLGDDRLDEALATIAQQTAAPVLSVLLYCTGERAGQWRSLGFNDASVRPHDVLARISVQPVGADGCGVVLHSTSDHARSHAGVHGSSSSAARVGGAASNADREAAIIEEMLEAVHEIPGLPVIERSGLPYGPLLHRWGNAYPQGEPLPPALAVCPDARVAFCGDYVATDARMGSCESALLSGVNVADAIRGYRPE